jgi:hypothetical protein
LIEASALRTEKEGERGRDIEPFPLSLSFILYFYSSLNNFQFLRWARHIVYVKPYSASCCFYDTIQPPLNIAPAEATKRSAVASFFFRFSFLLKGRQGIENKIKDIPTQKKKT